MFLSCCYHNSPDTSSVESKRVSITSHIIVQLYLFASELIHGAAGRGHETVSPVTMGTIHSYLLH